MPRPPASLAHALLALGLLGLAGCAQPAPDGQGGPDVMASPDRPAETASADLDTPPASADPSTPDASPDPDPATAPPGTAPSGPATEDTGALDPDLEDDVAVATSDLADDLGVDPAAIEVESAEKVVWPDGSVGCPEPGTMYTQATTPGSRIVLKAKGEAYSYHGVEGGVPMACDTPQVPPPIR